MMLSGKGSARLGQTKPLEQIPEDEEIEYDLMKANRLID